MFFQAEDGIRDLVRSRGLGDVYKRQYLDNADFFSVKSPQELNDEQLFARLMNEYPKWLEQAKQKQLLVRG